MTNKIFSEDCKTNKELIITPGAPIANVLRRIGTDVDAHAIQKGDAFAQEIEERFVSDFDKAVKRLLDGESPDAAGDGSRKGA